MFQGRRVGAVILVGGAGQRFGGEVPKQFLMLGGCRVYLHALRTFAQVGWFDEILLVCHPDWIEVVREESGAAVVLAGATRQESSFLGLGGFVERPDIVSIHDGARPFVSEKILWENVAMAICHGAVDTCIPSADTLVYSPDGEKIGMIPKREEFLRGQTPQTFRYDWIWKAHLAARREGLVNVSDDCSLILRGGLPVHIVRGSEENIKITTPLDLCFGEHLLKRERRRGDKPDSVVSHHSSNAVS